MTSNSDDDLVAALSDIIDLILSSGSSTEFSVVSQSLAMRSENRCCLHLYAGEASTPFAQVFTLICSIAA